LMSMTPLMHLTQMAMATEIKDIQFKNTWTNISSTRVAKLK
jgi:hypothetical protein